MRQQAAGFALVALQATFLALLSRTIYFPVLVVLVAGWGSVTRWRIPLSREQAFLLSTGAAFFFLLKHRFAPHEFPFGSLFIRTQIAYIIAQYLLTIEAAQFLTRRNGDSLSPVLPALGAVALVCIADVQITTEEQRRLTRLFAVAYAVLWAVYLWNCQKSLPTPAEGNQLARRQSARRRRLFAGAGILTAVAVGAWFSSLGFYRFDKTIENWVLGWMQDSLPSSQPGFSRSSQLGSIRDQKTEAENQVALRVYAEEMPGYLRGAVLTSFESSQWATTSVMRGIPLITAPEPPAGMQPLARNEMIYMHPAMRVHASTKWRYLECWPARDHLNAFTPLGTTHLKTAADRVGALPFGVFLLYEPEDSVPYTACVPETPPAYFLNPRIRLLWLEVPHLYHEPLAEIAKRVFADAKTTRDKIRAVERYFHENYRYHLGIRVPSGRDPLLFFLQEKPAAHCEYFATAAAMLLRSGGVPTRYVTGFVAAEWNPSGRYWIARNRDAHAWVEAYDETLGWITVEATPAGGVPSTAPPETKYAWWETLKNDWRRLRTYLGQGRWDRVGAVLRSTGVSWTLGLVLAGFAVYLAVRFRGRSRRARPERAGDPDLAEMHKLLLGMDQQLRRHGLIRGPSETLHQFARRVRDWEGQIRGGSARAAPPPFAERAGEWYDAYADFRYQGRWDCQTRAVLEARLPRLDGEDAS